MLRGGNTVIRRSMNFSLAATVQVLLVVTIITGCVATGSGTRRNQAGNDAADQNYQLGAQYYRKGNFELARDRLERAIAIDNRMADSHSLLALTLAELGNDRLATESFNKAVKLAPNNPDVRNSYAVYLCQQERYDEAIVQFERAIGIVDNDETFLMMTNAGVCISNKPDLVLAEKYFRDALRIRPTHGEALMQMAVLQHAIGDNMRARAFIQRYLSGNESLPGVLYLAVQIESALRDDRAATDYTNQLIREFPESPEALRLLQQD